MPIPFLFIGIAAVTGATGAGKTVKAGVDQSRAKKINANANAMIENEAQILDVLRKECGDSLQRLGEEKVFVLNNSVTEFLENFQKIKNVNFKESEGIMEVNKLSIDQKDFDDLKEMTNFSLSLAQGGLTGVAGGALTAFGAYSAASAFATASTGTAIASLSGAAATNATLAFFGGGALAAQGLGMAGGAAVLGGLVAGPALLVMGLITGAKAGKSLENARANEAKAEEMCEELRAGSDQCIAIRRRSYMFYSLLAKMDAYLYPLNQKMNKIIEAEGTDFSKYSEESQKSIAALVSTVKTIKDILDTPILKENGEPTEESEALVENMMDL